MTKEVLDLFNEQGEPLNKTIINGESQAKGEFIKGVLIWIKNSDGQFLIQKTSNRKGGLYSATGGHVASGETPQDTCVREIGEELGISITKAELKFVAKFKYDQKQVLFDVYYMLKNIPIKSMKLQTKEVGSVYWLNADKIEALIKTDSFRFASAGTFKFVKN